MSGINSKIWNGEAEAGNALWVWDYSSGSRIKQNPERESCSRN